MKNGKLRFIPGPTSVIEAPTIWEPDNQLNGSVESVIEAPLLVGFVGKKEQTGHPSQKPLSVFEKLILMTTEPGDIVFDPMCGSGTTGEASLKLGRKAILCDLSEEFIHLTEKRLKTKRTEIPTNTANGK